MPFYPFVESAGPHSATLQGTFSTGTIISLTWTQVIKAIPSCGTYFYAVSINQEQGPGAFQNIYYSPKPFGDPGSGSVQATVTRPSTQISLDVFADGYCSPGSINVTVFGSTPPAICAFGSRPQVGAPAAAEITADIVALVLSPPGLEWLAPVFGVLFGYWVETGPLCSTLPPPAPVIDLSTLNATWDTAWNIFKWVAWPIWCECTPGIPTPQPPPPPGATKPGGWPDRPPFPCSNLDVCSALIAMSQNIVAILDGMTSLGQLVTLLQRYKLPFAYVPQRQHTGLTGQGSFAVNRLVGFTVSITQTNNPQRTLYGTPGYEWDLGWMSLSDGGGMLQEKRITRIEQDWFPAEAQLGTLFGYALIDGVEMTLTELAAET